MPLSRYSLAFRILFLFALAPALAQAAAPSIQDVNQAFRQGNKTAALDKVNAFLAANPKDAQGRFLKGLILTELNRQVEAIKVFSDLTDDYPELPEPYNNLAVLYAAQAQYERAKNSLEMAIRTHPSYATAHENLGDIYAKMASQSYDKALQLDQSNTSALTKLAMIRDLFSPTRSDEPPAKGKTTAKGAAKSGQMARETQPPVEPARPALPPARPAEPAKPVEQPAEPPVAVEKPVEKPAEKPAVKPAEAAPADAKVAIEQTLRSWASAWSDRNADAYLAFYSSDFKVPGSRDRAAWEAERRDRVTRPEFIKVEIDRIKIKLDGDQAKVSFQQRYASNIVKKSSGYKTLNLAKQGEAWKIVGER